MLKMKGLAMLITLLETVVQAAIIVGANDGGVNLLPGFEIADLNFRPNERQFLNKSCTPGVGLTPPGKCIAGVGEASLQTGTSNFNCEKETSRILVRHPSTASMTNACC